MITMKSNENKEICSKCRGICCRNMPGQYVPDDLFDHEMTKEELKKFILEVGNISIDCWESDEESGYESYYYLRPMRRKLTLEEAKQNVITIDEKDPDNLSLEDKEKIAEIWANILSYSIKNFRNQDLTVDYGYNEVALVCCHLTENGCDLKFDKRPTNCKELIPARDTECYIEGLSENDSAKLYYAKKWEKYSDMLNDIANEIEFGKDYKEYIGEEE
jgi:hypothetical protein